MPRITFGRAIVAALVALLSSPFLAAAQDEAKPAIHVDHAWARATAGQLRTGAVYLTIVNTGNAPDRLTAASTAIAERTELHESQMENGVMKMHPTDPTTVPPGQSAVFKPGAKHLMLMGLKGPLKIGDSFPLTLTFDKTGAVDVTVSVEKGEATSSHGGMPMN